MLEENKQLKEMLLSYSQKELWALLLIEVHKLTEEIKKQRKGYHDSRF